MRSSCLSWVLAVAVAACVQRIERKVGPRLETVDLKAPYLKCHLKDGDVVVLADWTIDEARRELAGTGERVGPDRKVARSGRFRIRFDEVALYETNTIQSSPGVAGMAVVTGLSAAVTAACIANPKACFGSCPTFYAPGADGEPVLQAEGFSDAIAPSLETHDVDALARSTGGGRFTVRMTNEAYETHVVKQVDLLAVPRPAGGRVLADGERLWIASAVRPPVACAASEGDCLARVRALDGDERTSVTDGKDLATRETIEVALPPTGGRVGVVIGARQGMITTFLLYQGLAYLGHEATGWLAMLERDHASRSGGRALQRLVGGIEVQVPDGDAWRTVGEVTETGPLATDVHLVVLPDGVRPERIRLRLPRGGWRIDQVAVAALVREARPLRIAPSRIRGSISPDYASGRAPATGFPIVTMPGDAYDLEYELPAGEHEVFLDSRGYYLEWMRQEWLREQRPLAALRLLIDPAGALRDLAPAYKRIEPEIEHLFWSSRYARP